MKKQLFILACLCAAGAMAQQRKEITLNDNWQFSNDQRSWQTVDIPHDWAIGGPFDKKWDLQRVAIEQNGEKEPTEKSGRSGALPWIGKGCYRRTFSIPAGFKGHAELLFDGAMAEPVVYVNGQRAGSWAYGYNSFRIDATPFVKEGDNTLQVDLQNVEESSRWYPGAGLYRPVTLVLTGDSRLDRWTTFIRTTDITPTEARLRVTTHPVVAHKTATETDGVTAATAAATPAKAATTAKVAVTLRDARGRIVATANSHLLANGEADLPLTVASPKLWSPESPYLYTATIELTVDGRTADAISQKVGIRTVSVSKEGGFQLNGVTRKLKGVCLHHDLGPLGAAVNKAALIRQLKTMKDMGCDAIRTAHNMPSQMQMDLCDSLGMMVMAESFDMWLYPKCKNGYARFFSEWSDRDIDHLVRANRNHPSIVMWSIGNEIPEQWSEQGRDIAAHLQALCHQLDPTRPVTQGMDRAEDALKSGFAQVMDVPGFNYRVHKYPQNIKQLPKGFLLGSETASTVSSRGVYKFPVRETDYSEFASYSPNYDPTAIQRADGQCSSYDVEWCPWSNLPDDDWRWQDDEPWVIGEFVWTGYDYLGEPTPYDEYWPSRSSYFGICDLAGLPKDRYYLYRSHWNTKEHTIHLLPHWTWSAQAEGAQAAADRTHADGTADRTGLVTPVYCYTDYPEGELFVNGKSQGRIRKNRDSRLDRYRLRWNDVRYEPGELRVVVYDEQGKAAGEQTLRTAGAPSRLVSSVWTQHSNTPAIADPHQPLTDQNGIQTAQNGTLTAQQATQSTLTADGTDLAFVTVSLVDEQGTLIPYATDQLHFEVEGAGTFRAVCNGDATSLESFTQPTMRLFGGQLVVVVQAANRPGSLRLRITDPQRHLTHEVTIPVR